MSDAIEVLGPLDICQAQKRATILCRAAGLTQQAGFQFVIAVSELANHLFLVAGKKGRLTLSLVRRRARSGLEVVAEVDAGHQWAVGLPSVEGLVDELDAGFGRDGRIMVTARAWSRESEERGRRGAAPGSAQVLGAGPRPAFAES